MIHKDNVLVVDIDGTLCDIKDVKGHYADVRPEPLMVARLRELAENGWRIILHSSRGMRSNDGNLGLINRNVGPVLLKWLAEHNIPFDELHLGKPWPGRNGFYIDDRAIRPREFVENSLEQIEALLKKDRIAKG